MKTTWALSAIMMSLSLAACSQSNTQSPDPVEAAVAWQQSQLNDFASQLDVKYRIVTNIPEEACAEDAKADERCFIVEIDLTSSTDLALADWEIYFSQMRPVKAVLNDQFNIERVKGDLHRLTPNNNFTGFKAGETKTVRFRGESWLLSEVDGMPNYYIVAKDAQGQELQPQIIASTMVQVDPETGMEVRPYVEEFVDAKRQYQRTEQDKLVWAKPEVLFKQNSAVAVDETVVSYSLLPTPKTQTLADNPKKVSLANGVSLDKQSLLDAGIEYQAIEAAVARLARLGVTENEAGVKVRFSKADKTTDSEAGSYQLTIANDAISITAHEASGFSYGIASLTSLLSLNDLTVSTMQIEDSPRYQYRGMHVDVSRNFHSKQFMLDLIDQMAAYKLNKLHLHMGDDEGWRLEIDGLPELTDVGSKRCHDFSETRCILPQLGSGPNSDTPVNGFYSMADYVELVQYADARQIQVIPSMDMPGHSRAAIKAMDVRYKNLMAQGNETAAKEFLLTDAQDTTVYSSVQYYDDNTLNVCMESTYHFVDKVVSEIAKLHEKAGQPLTTYHIGADETAGAWLESPICEAFIADNEYGITDIKQVGAYFIERVANMLADKGIQPGGWSDGMSHTNVAKMPGNSQSNIWDVIAHKGHQRAHQQVNHGWATVLSNPEVLYFDFPYEADPKEHGYYWASRATNSQKVFSFMTDNLPANAEQWQDIEGNPFEADDRKVVDENGKLISGPIQQGKAVAGIQGQLWSETVRSDQTAEYMIYPRLLMLAERAWHKPSWEVPYQYEGQVYNQHSGFFTESMRAQQAKDWQKMANHLGQKELAKLEKAGIEYRIPTVGAVINNGLLEMNVAFPGLALEYKEQGKQWQAYAEPVKVSAPVEVRAISPDGKRKGRTQIVN
ncbi:family 20 glycosylhydrolase [Shewanella gaetbuli]|uniref:beta-N-acetylhexosaminidase n=1 Tax=Shewanella gaetbuli TaxID=220752 RepID=A0A9X1ZTI9_9GAMM|nr:family 20 glycosylhydrolase [Shewanella gaetbuli]MCL1141876.1 carbohydate-binding domain-containing protein [Shewanella gaetbuli]